MTVLSRDAEASVAPSGLNATPVTSARVSAERLAPRLARVDVPEDHGLVVGRGGERLPVRAERHAGHAVRVSAERLAPRLARRRRPRG